MGSRKRRTQRKVAHARPKRSWLVYLLLLVVLSAPFAVGYVLWLDRQVVAQFEGKRWALPARVYARPLELYEGTRLRPQHLVAEFEALGYRPVAQSSAPGTYSRNGNEFRVTTRGFRFPDGEEQARRAVIRFEGNRVAALSAADGGELPILRLEPAIIGGIYPAHGEDRVLVRLEDVPPELIHALLVVEDRNFFQHRGISWSGIARAAVANVRAGRVVQGGSTITQQLVKNFYLTSDRTLRRKINEAIMALLLEYRYDKYEILEAYLNEVYLAQDGNRSIHGFGLAAEYYFSQPLEDLRLDQLAMMAGLVKGPSFYNPRRHPQRTKERRDLVLRMLHTYGSIDAETAQRAIARELDVSPAPHRSDNRYPAFMDLVQQHLRRDYRAEDLSSEGLQIFTTLVPHVQEAAQRSLDQRLQAIDSELQGAGVVVNVDDGTVAALIGGREAGYLGFNRAMQARRPVGSLIKPAVYLAALSRPDRYGLGSLVLDSPMEVQDAAGRRWEPKNYSGRYHGQVPLWQALANSYNVSTVWLGLDVGLPAVVDALERLGLRPPSRVYASLLLGAVNYTPLEVAQMYQTIASGGYQTPLRAVQSVMDAEGEVLQSYPLAVEQVFDGGEVFLLDYALRQAMRSGTGRSAGRHLPPGLTVAGKTGTTNDTRDSWFAGYSSDMLGVFWLGHDDNRSTGLTGASGALQVWGQTFASLELRPLPDSLPASVEMSWIEPASGLRAEEYCADVVQLPYIRGKMPPDAACVEDAQPRRGRFRGWFQ
ncbi:penicillin-binding protein 1B [Alkalilimnicola ehrlichii]|uniref:Penicillin-binding protein 1B n=1 Tax=Alkalilimnicola ehrlichii TaxID=351052 RepID=A0A3E0X3H4_9GAMM|nr:penicillin-binding protein 1B [Alkalilimnicola ehrlichii]RFA31050.1 penicillin-binding protein 1B [Alkalilimnicola ehrlichii]RFA39006.1 penicillin-binding protein 1B [Alkalilimnicola ehrlichii]